MRDQGQLLEIILTQVIKQVLELAEPLLFHTAAMALSLFLGRMTLSWSFGTNQVDLNI
jgi:hypothetical protein